LARRPIARRREPHVNHKHKEEEVPYAPTLPERLSHRELRQLLLGAGEYLGDLLRQPTTDRGEGFEVDVRSATQFIRDWDVVAVAFERGEAIDASAGVPQVATDVRNPGRRTAGDLLVNDESFMEFAREGRAGRTFHEFNLDGSLFAHNNEYRTLIAEGTTASPIGGMWTGVGTPSDFPPRVQQRRFFFRDLCTVIPTTLPVVPYIRELNAQSLEGSASAVGEASSKPEVTITWTTDNAVIKKLAAWVPLTTEIIEDAPTLRGYVDTRLAYMLAVREEDQLINGSGTGDNVKGLLQFGIPTQGAGTDVPATFASAIAKIEMIDGFPDAIVMNPTKYWTMLSTRYSTQLDGSFGEGGLPYVGAVSPFSGGAYGTMWNLPILRTRFLTTNKAIVGSFRMGATIFDRMRTQIMVGNQHSTFFVENKVAVVAEERVGLAVHRPDFFVDVTLP
jgi:HK97 family phage major capsid protein